MIIKMCNGCKATGLDMIAIDNDYHLCCDCLNEILTKMQMPVEKIKDYFDNKIELSETPKQAMDAPETKEAMRLVNDIDDLANLASSKGLDAL